MTNHEVALSMVNGATGEFPAIEVQQQLSEQYAGLRLVEQEQATNRVIEPVEDLLGRIAFGNAGRTRLLSK